MTIGHAAAIFLDQFARRDAGRRQHDARLLHTARHREGAEAPALAPPLAGEPFGAALDDVAHPIERLDVLLERRTAEQADLPLDFGTLEKYGCFVGSHAVVILSDKDDMKAVALNLLRFFEDESCGQCTPCRVGTEKAVKLMATGPWDKALLTELSDAMRDASICGLGQAAPNPLLSVLKYFPEELSKPLGSW